MKLKLNIIHYYTLLLTMLAFQAGNTVYKLSGTIGNSEQLTYLQTQEVKLEKELALLQEEQHNIGSLTSISRESQVEYQAIASTVTMTLHNTVASR